MPAPLILTRQQVEKVKARRIRFAARVLILTGCPYLVSHPFVRSNRLCWSSASATLSTIVGKH
jgi:hypothetical protein